VGTPGGGDLIPSLGAGRSEEDLMVQTLANQEPAQDSLSIETLEALPELPKPANPDTATSKNESKPGRKIAQAASADAQAPKPAQRNSAERIPKSKSKPKPAKAGAKAKARSEGKRKAKAAAKKTKTGR
jgi:hypothetical protein